MRKAPEKFIKEVQLANLNLLKAFNLQNRIETVYDRISIDNFALIIPDFYIMSAFEEKKPNIYIGEIIYNTMSKNIEHINVELEKLVEDGFLPDFKLDYRYLIYKRLFRLLMAKIMAMFKVHNPTNPDNNFVINKTYKWILDVFDKEYIIELLGNNILDGGLDDTGIWILEADLIEPFNLCENIVALYLTQEKPLPDLIEEGFWKIDFEIQNAKEKMLV